MDELPERGQQLLPKHCSGVIDPELLLRHAILLNLKLRPNIGQSSTGHCAHRLHVHGEHLHGGNTVGLDGFLEVVEGIEGCASAPCAQAAHVPQMLHLRGGGGGDVEHRGVGATLLQALHVETRLGAGLVVLVGNQILGLVHFVEANESSGLAAAQPLDQLPQPGIPGREFCGILLAIAILRILGILGVILGILGILPSLGLLLVQDPLQ
mmetsp:Transcript_87953/g.210174  ORF Transcript_87953/g.210174 Transcript_87953/m.210174 type:complete len:210 (-) Transcript_87953:1366-1995(-)